MATEIRSLSCMLCFRLESGLDSDYLVVTPNQHMFHYIACLKEKLRKNGSRCPICKEEIQEENLTRLNGLDVSRVSNKARLHQKSDYRFKVAILGDSNVGKTSLLLRYKDGKFNAKTQSTVAIDMYFKQVHVDGRIVLLNLWDTSGQEKCAAIGQNLVRNAHGVIFVYGYGANETQSLESIQKWKDFTANNGVPGAAYILVGNKADIPAEKRSITTQQGQRFARRSGMSFFETSAKDGLNVDALFCYLATELLQYVQNGRLEVVDGDLIRLGDNDHLKNTEKDESSCC